MTALAIGFGALLGLLADRFHVPGGLILGSMVGAASVSLWLDAEVTISPVLNSAALLLIGSSIGVLVTRDMMSTLRPVLVGAVLAAVLIIAAGLAIGLLLRSLGLAPPGDILATSPGALTVMAAAALDHGRGAAEVAAFHLIRIILVIASLPLLRVLLPEAR